MSTTVRIGSGSSKDNTGSVLQFENQGTKAYSASVAITTSQNVSNTLVTIGQATGALALTVGVGTSTTDPQVGDRLTILMSSDATGRVVTFSTGFASSGTLTMVASKKASAQFIFDGVAWVETNRAIGA